ncbi:MAG: hypothetical protein CMM93_06140 [Rickettsiales bacterium]|nr:hypothetical protein [Rickettsiales bacterium]
MTTEFRLPHWEVSVDGIWLTRHFRFENFLQAHQLVMEVAMISERLQHHPEIRYGWGYVELRITSHDAGELTQKDINWIEQVEQLPALQPQAQYYPLPYPTESKIN